MKYDKYGDPIEETGNKMTPKRKRAFTIVMLIQLMMIVLNVVIILVKALSGYLCFITAPFYIFVYVEYLKTLTPLRDDGIPVKKYQLFAAFSLIAYIATAAIAIFATFID